VPIAQSTRSSGADRAIGLPAPTAAGYPLSHELTDFHFAHLATAILPEMSFMFMRKVCEVKLGALLRCVMTLPRGRPVWRQAPPAAGCLECHPGAPERERFPPGDLVRPASAGTIAQPARSAFGPDRAAPHNARHQNEAATAPKASVGPRAASWSDWRESRGWTFSSRHRYETALSAFAY
jgi:hypothetical protein